MRIESKLVHFECSQFVFAKGGRKRRTDANDVIDVIEYNLYAKGKRTSNIAAMRTPCPNGRDIPVSISRPHHHA